MLKKKPVIKPERDFVSPFLFEKQDKCVSTAGLTMMMLKMMNPFGSVTDSIPGVGGGGGDDDSGETKEEQMEQERLRQEAIKQAERERRDKYKKQEEERESMRQTIRDKVQGFVYPFHTAAAVHSGLASHMGSYEAKVRIYEAKLATTDQHGNLLKC